MKSYKLAFLNLSRRRVTTLIAIGSIAISVACSGVLLRLYLLSSSRFVTMAEGGDALVGAKSGGIDILLGSLNLEGEFPDFIPFRLFESLREQQTVGFEDGATLGSSFSRLVIPFVYFGKFRQYRIIGTDESFLHRPETEKDPILEGVWAKEIGEVVLGAQVAKSSGVRIGETIDATTWVSKEDIPPEKFKLKVVGIFRPMHSVWDNALFSNLKQSRLVFATYESHLKTIWGPDVLHYYLVYVKTGGFKDLENLINRRTVAQAINITVEKDKLLRLTGEGQRLGFLISILIMFLGALSVAAMMVTRFDSMMIQLAVLRAIGYSKLNVTAWLLWEGLYLGIIATTIGAGLDYLLFPIIKTMLEATLPNSDLISSPLYQSMPIWVACLLGTILAASIPLMRLYGQNIHDSLKGL